MSTPLITSPVTITGQVQDTPGTDGYNSLVVAGYIAYGGVYTAPFTAPDTVEADGASVTYIPRATTYNDNHGRTQIIPISIPFTGTLDGTLEYKCRLKVNGTMNGGGTAGENVFLRMRTMLALVDQNDTVYPLANWNFGSDGSDSTGYGYNSTSPNYNGVTIANADYGSNVENVDADFKYAPNYYTENSSGSTPNPRFTSPRRKDYRTYTTDANPTADYPALYADGVEHKGMSKISVSGVTSLKLAVLAYAKIPNSRYGNFEIAGTLESLVYTPSSTSLPIYIRVGNDIKQAEKVYLNVGGVIKECEVYLRVGNDIKKLG